MSQQTDLDERSKSLAETLVSQHLNGRYLPKAARLAVVRVTQGRFDGGRTPALSAELRGYIDRHSIAPEQAFPKGGARARMPGAGFHRMVGVWR